MVAPQPIDIRGRRHYIKDVARLSELGLSGSDLLVQIAVELKIVTREGQDLRTCKGQNVRDDGFTLAEHKF